ncbi:hypothetical protein [Streptomyces vinaceus]|uniref:hypothetical protein n=1 Tax=Streptomyces vinaceus TaxID=1960 RepID=UPI003830BC5A
MKKISVLVAAAVIAASPACAWAADDDSGTSPVGHQIIGNSNHVVIGDNAVNGTGHVSGTGNVGNVAGTGHSGNTAGTGHTVGTPPQDPIGEVINVTFSNQTGDALTLNGANVTTPTGRFLTPPPATVPAAAQALWTAASSSHSLAQTVYYKLPSGAVIRLYANAPQGSDNSASCDWVNPTRLNILVPAPAGYRCVANIADSIYDPSVTFTLSRA